MGGRVDTGGLAGQAGRGPRRHPATHVTGCHPRVTRVKLATTCPESDVKPGDGSEADDDVSRTDVDTEPCPLRCCGTWKTSIERRGSSREPSASWASSRAARRRARATR